MLQSPSATHERASAVGMPVCAPEQQKIAEPGAVGVWLGREGSNLRMAESKSAALPLGYAPTLRGDRRKNRRNPSDGAGL